MKFIIAVLLIAVVAAGCRKGNEAGPQNHTSTKSPADTTVKAPPVNTSPVATVKLTHDDSIHLAAFVIYPQTVNTSVSGTNLVLKFNENVNLLFTAVAYTKTSAIHLKEDFSGAMLAGFDFTAVAEGGNTTLNWADDNLNNVKQKTIKDTVINGVNMVNVNVHRQFTFFKVYPSNQAALNQQASFVSKKDDEVVFSSYCYYNQKNYPVDAAVAYLVYLK